LRLFRGANELNGLSEIIYIRHSGYERLARYGGKGATQREAELCALSTHRCHFFPPNSLAEIASHTRAWSTGIIGCPFTNGRLPTKARDSRLHT